MSDDESQVECEELQKWFGQISKQSWYELIKTNHDELSISYIDLISEFASLMQSTLRNHCKFHQSSLDSILLMKGLRQKLPQLIESLFSSVNLEELTNQEIKDDEEVASDLFTRVLEIFHRDNRTVTDLYNDLDINKDGKIKFEELRAEFLKSDPSITIEESKAVFDLLDGNKDGFISLHELTKRTKLIEDKAQLERNDPLACMVVSKPLDPGKIHGNLSVMLLKGENLKPGTHSAKIKLPGILEYLTPDVLEANHYWNFRADFFLENRTEDDLPLLVEVELLNKNKVEGIGSFQWKKTMNMPNEFSLKVKIPIKTSTGQVRGSLSFQAMWTPIQVRKYTEEEIKKRRALEIEIIKKRREQGSQSLVNLNDDDDLFSLSDEDLLEPQEDEMIREALEFSEKNNEKPKDNVQSRLEEIKKIEKELEDIEKEQAGLPENHSLHDVKTANRKSMNVKKSVQKEEELPSGRKSTKISLHRRDTSYSYIMKVGKVTVEEVIKKNLKQPKIAHPAFKVTSTNRKTVDLGKVTGESSKFVKHHSLDKS